MLGTDIPSLWNSQHWRCVFRTAFWAGGWLWPRRCLLGCLGGAAWLLQYTIISLSWKLASWGRSGRERSEWNICSRLNPDEMPAATEKQTTRFRQMASGDHMRAWWSCSLEMDKRHRIDACTVSMSDIMNRFSSSSAYCRYRRRKLWKRGRCPDSISRSSLAAKLM